MSSGYGRKYGTTEEFICKKNDTVHAIFENQLLKLVIYSLHSAVFKAQIHFSGPDWSKPLNFGLTIVNN